MLNKSISVIYELFLKKVHIKVGIKHVKTVCVCVLSVRLMEPSSPIIVSLLFSLAAV